MVLVCLPRRRSWSRWVAVPAKVWLGLNVVLTPMAGAQSGTAVTKPASAPPAAKAAAPSDVNQAPDVADAVADPSQSSKVESSQTFKDKNAEALLDVNRFPEIRARQAATAADVEGLKVMASTSNAPIDKAMIERVVDFMIAKLTSHTNLNSILADPQKGTSAAGNQANIKEIQDATATMLEPIFMARAQGNVAFLSAYNRILLAKLDPVLKNHLVARVQAMIVLGQGASAEAIKLYVRQIRDAKQTIWVKLWALEGISKIKTTGGNLNAADTIDAAKAISVDFLDDTGTEIPWPVKLRALSALGSLRQGFVVSAPKKAEMANTAMRILADGDERFEVRAEAARALGLMQITSSVPKYNYPLIAFAIGQLTVDLATKINSCFSGDLVKSRQLDQPDKARYFSALLVGPVYQAFDGVTGARDSGLLHSAAASPPAFVQTTFDLVTAVMKAIVPMLNSGPRLLPEQKKELAAKIASLKAFLAENPPADTRLVQNGPQFKVADGASGSVASRRTKLAGVPGGR